MPRFIHSILQPQGAIAADAQVDYDLPVNPLSGILLHLTPLNETSTIANYTALSGLLSALDNIRIAYKGASIFNMSGFDLYAFIAMVGRGDIMQSNLVETDDDRRSLVLPVPLARKWYDPDECFPETKRGELIMQIDWDIADTGFDALRVSIETIELPDARPTHFQKATTLTQTFAATGDNDIDLPIGNIIRGILLYGTTAYTGATPAPSLGELRLLVDNMEWNYAATDFEVLRAVHALNARRLSAHIDHFHSVSDDGANDVDSNDQQITTEKYGNYAYMDMDPNADDMYSLVTTGAGRIHLRSEAETADLVRAIPIEKMAVDEFLRP